VAELGWDGLTDWQRFSYRLTGRYTAYILERTARQCVAILEHARLGEPVPAPDRG
jgi:hypothetical protein